MSNTRRQQIQQLVVCGNLCKFADLSDVAECKYLALLVVEEKVFQSYMMLFCNFQVVIVALT